LGLKFRFFCLGVPLHKTGSGRSRGIEQDKGLKIGRVPACRQAGLSWINWIKRI